MLKCIVHDQHKNLTGLRVVLVHSIYIGAAPLQMLCKFILLMLIDKIKCNFPIIINLYFIDLVSVMYFGKLKYTIGIILEE